MTDSLDSGSPDSGSLDSGKLLRARGRGQRLLAKVTLLGLLIGAASAQTDRKGEGPPTISDEMVGTLPLTYTPGGGGFGTFVNEVRVNLYLEGDPVRVLAAIDALQGPAHVALERLPLGEVRAVIRGEAQIDLRRLAFHDGELRLGVLFGSQSGSATIGLVHGSRMVSRTSIHPMQELPVPMPLLVDSGALDTGLRIVSNTPLGRRSFVTIVETMGAVRISQGE